MRPCERSRRAAAVVAGVLAVLRTLPASAADEVISDPELQGAKAAAPKGDEVISDPELDSKPAAGQGTSAGASPAAPAPTTTTAPSESRPEYPHDAIFRVTFGTRWGVDTDWARPSQDIVEGTTIGVVEASQRRSEALLLSVGLRARHGFGMRHDGNTRSEIDVVPISAFADVTPAEGYHVRAGYQVISMGRFDVFSATNFLAVYDLRSGPATMPEAAAFGQPAVRLDFDKIPGFTLQAYYLPFFTPDIVSVYGSNYAPVDRYLDASCNATASTPGATPCPALDSSENRSAASTGASSALRALAPAPDLTTPQGAIRATLSGSAGELSATVGTALERIPAFGPSAAFLAALANTPNQLPNEPFVHHDRFGVASLDAATDVGPIQLGFEAAYMMHRTLVANGTGNVPGTGVTTGTPPMFVQPVATVANFVEHADLVQGGLRAELVEAAGWAAEVEGFVLAALSKPAESNLSWATMEQGRFWRGVAGGVHFAPPDTKLKLEVGGVVFSGPSYLVMPRAEWEAIETVYLELGAVFVGGPTPTFTVMPGGGTSGWTGPMSLGGLFSDVDQIFTGVRWVP